MWSPDGRHLAYRGAVGRAGSCWGTVIISDPAGHRVASFPGEGWLISWSPDSTRVATWVRPRQVDTIGIYGLDGVRQALLTVPPGLMEPATSTRCGRPTVRRWWSRKGWRSPSTVPLRWFYRRTTHERTLVPRRRPTDLGSPGSTTHPRGGEDKCNHIWRQPTVSLVVAEPDGSQARALTPGGVQDFKWSPTGDRIAFESQTGRSETDGPPHRTPHRRRGEWQRDVPGRPGPGPSMSSSSHPRVTRSCSQARAPTV